MARILVAEPDRRIRDFIAGMLADCGHAVEACADDIEALASLAAGPIDVIVTDLVLRRSKCAVFTQNCPVPGIPTITLSGCEFQPGGQVIERPSALLEKPFRFADLQSVVHAVAFCSRSPLADGPISQDASH